MEEGREEMSFWLTGRWSTPETLMGRLNWVGQVSLLIIKMCTLIGDMG